MLPSKTAVGRLRPVVTLRDFFSAATCYSEPNGRVRPRADTLLVSNVENQIMKIRPVSCALACIVLTSAVQAAPLVSYFPKKDLGVFLADKFDLASIRSSFGPRRSPLQRTFSDFGMKPSKATEDALVFEIPGDWLYELKIVGRRDVNKDGIEDLEVCFVDHALNGGTYDTSQGLLITRYSADSYAVALSFSLNDGICQEYAR
jgi:hypothetical protein